MTTWDKYKGRARNWTETAYARPEAYLDHRASLIVTLGDRLEPGDTVLDLACGDAGLAAHLPAQRYLGVDAEPEMVAAARAAGVEVIEANLNDFQPEGEVDAVTIFRALYYIEDRPSFFARIAERTRKKLVFDLDTRRYSFDSVANELRSAGLPRLETRPFFVPQTRALPRVALRCLIGLERTPVAPLLLRRRFTLMVAAMH